MGYGTLLYLTEWWEGADAHSRSLAQDSVSRPWTLHERRHVSVITHRTKLGGDIFSAPLVITMIIIIRIHMYRRSRVDVVATSQTKG